MVTDLQTLLRAIVDPHEAPAGQKSRLSLQGPAVLIGSHATNGIALVAHELATNAIKYGALREAVGTVGVDWKVDGKDLRLRWIERGGVRVEGPPASTGFGTQLVRQTITGSLGGAIHYDWKTEGLDVEICFPLERVKL